MSLADRVLWQATDEQGAGDPAVRLETLGIVLLLHAAAETWFSTFELQRVATGVVLLAVAYTALLVLGCASRFRRIALAGTAAVTLIQVVWTFPFIANHTYLRLFATGWLVLYDPLSLRERRLTHATLSWLTVIVLFYTGFQKLIYGT